MINVLNKLFEQARDLEERAKSGKADAFDVVWAWDALHARALHYGYTSLARVAKIKSNRWARSIN